MKKEGTNTFKSEPITSDTKTINHHDRENRF